jgi:hypothetical protein
MPNPDVSLNLLVPKVGFVLSKTTDPMIEELSRTLVLSLTLILSLTPELNPKHRLKVKPPLRPIAELSLK